MEYTLIAVLCVFLLPFLIVNTLTSSSGFMLFIAIIATVTYVAFLTGLVLVQKNNPGKIRRLIPGAREEKTTNKEEHEIFFSGIKSGISFF